jgi:hypothetical protein
MALTASGRSGPTNDRTGRRLTPMNAADLYHKAFACLPEGALDAYSGRLGRDDPETDRFVERGRDSLDLLHHAARCAECNWGSEAALGTPVDDFSCGRRLAVLALLRAEGSFRRGDDRAGLDDLAAVMALGRHLGRGKYISGLAGFPIEDLAATKAFEVLDCLDPETCRAFAERLDSLPSLPVLSEALRAEQTYFLGNYRETFAALDDGDVSRPIRDAFGLPSPTEQTADLTDWVFPDGDPAERMLLASGGTRSGLLALADEVLAAFGALAEIAEGAGNAPSEKLSALRNAAGSNPLLSDVLRAFDTMRPIWDRFDRRFARLRSLALAGSPDTGSERPPGSSLN